MLAVLDDGLVDQLDYLLDDVRIDKSSHIDYNSLNYVVAIEIEGALLDNASVEELLNHADVTFGLEGVESNLHNSASMLILGIFINIPRYVSEEEI